MPTTESDPAAMFKELAQSYGPQEQKMPVGQGAPYNVDVVHNVDTFSVTYRGGSGQLMNGIVLVHDLVMAPSFGRDDDAQAPRICDYWICVQPIRPGGESVAPFGGDGHTPGAFSAIPATVPYQLANVRDSTTGLMSSSLPQTTEANTTFSTGGSQTFSESVGFFGDTPTATATSSTSVSWGTTTSVSDVRIENLSKSNISIVHYVVGSSNFPPFCPNSDIPAPVAVSQTTFQPQLSQLFEFPDDGQTVFTRDGTPYIGPYSEYLFMVWVVARVVKWGGRPILVLPDMLAPSFYWGCSQRLIQVKQSPLAGQVKAPR